MFEEAAELKCSAAESAGVPASGEGGTCVHGERVQDTRRATERCVAVAGDLTAEDRVALFEEQLPQQGCLKSSCHSTALGEPLQVTNVQGTMLAKTMTEVLGMERSNEREGRSM